MPPVVADGASAASTATTRRCPAFVRLALPLRRGHMNRCAVAAAALLRPAVRPRAFARTHRGGPTAVTRRARRPAPAAGDYGLLREIAIVPSASGRPVRAGPVAAQRNPLHHRTDRRRGGQRILVFPADVDAATAPSCTCARAAGEYTGRVSPARAARPPWSRPRRACPCSPRTSGSRGRCGRRPRPRSPPRRTVRPGPGRRRRGCPKPTTGALDNAGTPRTTAWWPSVRASAPSRIISSMNRNRDS